METRKRRHSTSLWQIAKEIELLIILWVACIMLLACTPSCAMAWWERPPGKPMTPMPAHMRYSAQMKTGVVCDPCSARQLGSPESRFINPSGTTTNNLCCVKKRSRQFVFSPKASPQIDNYHADQAYRMTPQARTNDPFLRQAPGVNFPRFTIPFPSIPMAAPTPTSAIPPNLNIGLSGTAPAPPAPPPPFLPPPPPWIEPPTV